MYEAHYRILDFFLTLTSDSTEFISRFDEAYGWFRVPSSRHGHGLGFSVILQKGRPYLERTRIGTNTDLKSLNPVIQYQSQSDHHTPSNWSLLQIINAVFLEIEDFMFLHAGVVEYNGSALILAGHPGAGKTTLVFELLKRGFRFMSDDTCPIHKISRRAHPFPRTPRLVQSSAGKEPLRWDDKTSVALEQLPGSLFGLKSCPVGWVMCLDDMNCNSGDQQFHIFLKNGSGGALLGALRSFSGVEIDMVGQGSQEVWIRYPKKLGLTGEIREQISLHRSAIKSVFRSDRAQPDFRRKPVMESIPTHEAAFNLLRHMEAVDTYLPAEGCTARLWECATLLGGAFAWRLRVGELEETVDLIMDTVKATGSGV